MIELALRHRIETLETENERLLQQVESLKARLAAAVPPRGRPANAVLGLTAAQAAVADLLLTRELVTKPAIILATSELAKSNRTDGTRVATVFICLLRSRLKQHGVTIENHRSQGWSLSPSNRARLRALLAPALEQEAA